MAVTSGSRNAVPASRRCVVCSVRGPVGGARSEERRSGLCTSRRKQKPLRVTPPHEDPRSQGPAGWAGGVGSAGPAGQAGTAPRPEGSRGWGDGPHPGASRAAVPRLAARVATRGPSRFCPWVPGAPRMPQSEAGSAFPGPDCGPPVSPCNRVNTETASPRAGQRKQQQHARPALETSL